MIININRQSLVEPLKNIIGVSEQNQTMPILGHVLMEIKDGVCFLTATDLEVQVSYSYDIGVSENIRITVPARKFTDILRSLEAENVTLEVTPKDIVIKSGKSKFRVSALNPDDFPIITDDISDCMKIDSEALLKLVNSTSFSMGYQDARHFLNGLFIEFSQNNITAVATDGHRLACSLRACELSSSEKSCIVPRKCINELKRILSSFNEINDILTEVSVSSKNIQFVCMVINCYLSLSRVIILIITRCFLSPFPTTLRLIDCFLNLHFSDFQYCLLSNLKVSNLNYLMACLI